MGRLFSNRRVNNGSLVHRERCAVRVAERMRIVFLSDTHLSMVRKRPWPDIGQRAQLQAFLKGLRGSCAGPLRSGRIVLLGDIFDTWRCPPGEEPPSYEELFARHDGLMTALRALAEDGRLVYVAGNHDHDLCGALLEQRLPGVQWIGSGHAGNDAFVERSCRLYAVHGHRYSVFNDVSHPRRLLEGFPIGYYITRLRAGMEDGGEAFSFGQIHEYLEAAQGILTGRRGLLVALICSLKGRTRRIRLPCGRSIAFADLVCFAKGLSRGCSNVSVSIGAATESTLTIGANRACLEEGARLVVFGHTHRPLLDEAVRFPPWHRRTYANAGCWCGNAPHYVVADTEQRSLTLVSYGTRPGRTLCAGAR